MSCYIVSFEVASAETANAIRAQLQKFSGYCPILATCWAVLSDQTPLEVANALHPIVKPGDRVFVARSNAHCAWINPYTKAHEDWLKKNL